MGQRTRLALASRKFYVFGIAIALGLAVLRLDGFSAIDLVHLARAKLSQARADAAAVGSEEYAKRYARRLREEAATIPVVVPDAAGPETAELGGELQAERKRIMEERADQLQKVGVGVLHGDLEALKQRADENARRAAGDH
jgi:hypothetical protein